MAKKLFTTALLVFAFVAFSFAQDLTGHWTAKVMDHFDIAYDFKVDGEKLTGKTSGFDGTPIPIQNGVIKGGDMSFTINMMGNDLKITGKVKDYTITLTRPGMSGGDPMTVVLKKTK